MNARKQSAPHWLYNVILNITANLRKRVRKNLPEILMAMILSIHRRTVTGWLGCLQNGAAKSSVYYQIGSFGRYGNKLEDSVANFLSEYCDILKKAKMLYFVIDDTPTKRTGPKIEGANYQHNPTPSKTDAKLYYGHSWVVLAIVVYHPRWGFIALPLRHILYIRECDVKKLSPKQQEEHPFRTKLTMATELIQWASEQFSHLNKEMVLLIDGGYTSNEVIAAAKKAKMKVITRLRKDSAIFTVPEPPKQKRPGRPKKYGDRKEISVWEHSVDDPWCGAVCSLYGKETEVEYKAAVVTSRLTDGEPFKLVMSRREEGQNVLFFCSDVNESPEEIIKAYSLRFSIEEMFKDLKEVEGIGKQQVRKLESNIGAFTLCLLMYTLVELWAWDKSNDYLTQYTRGDYDDPNRRPSHSDKRSTMRLEIKAEEFKRVYGKWLKPYLLKRCVRCIYSSAV